MRSVYVPAVCTVVELMTDRIAAAFAKDPCTFRRELCPDPRLRAVLDKVAEAGPWGRPMPDGTAQGIAICADYKSRLAVLVELDARRQTVDRQIEHAYTGPRVRRLVLAVDVGKVINPMGLEAQMMGGAMDGIAQALTAGLHFRDGLPLESSWDNYGYTRQWNCPEELTVIIMPSTTDVPTGAGEIAVGVTQAAVACAWARATGRMPTEFPLNASAPLPFVPAPTVPPVPQSPADGLHHIRTRRP